MNLKLRLKNKTTLVALILATIGFIYQILAIFGITAPVAEEMWKQLVMLTADILVALGVLVDPTTTGIKDSDRAMDYIAPSKPLTDIAVGTEYEEVEYNEIKALHNEENYGQLIENIEIDESIESVSDEEVEW